MWKISKEFGFDYGHRVWSQELNSDFSIQSKCVCRHQHGHRGKLLVYLESNELNEEGMVTDFHHLNWFSQFLDEYVDHKMLLDINDPAFSHFYPLLAFTSENERDNLFDFHSEKFYTPKHSFLERLPIELFDVYEGIVLVPFIPTSENLSKWFFDITSQKMKEINVKVGRIQFFETPKSQSNYYSD